MRIITLKAIVFQNEHNAIPAWLNRVQEWMKQWTVENNYASIPVENEYAQYEAVKIWREIFLENVKMHFNHVLPAWARDSFQPADFFAFHYEMSGPVVLNKSLDLCSSRASISLNKVDEYAAKLEQMSIDKKKQDEQKIANEAVQKTANESVPFPKDWSLK